jgi:hypothetical protein
MKLTDRDKQLVIWMPALALVIGYAMIVASAPNARVKRLRQQVAQARAMTPGQFDVGQYEAQLARFALELTTIKAESAKVQSAVSIPGSPANIRAAEQVAALLPRHHLALIEQSGVAMAPGEVLPVLQRLIVQYGEVKGPDLPAFWRVKFTGTYLDVVAALDELATADYCAVPTNLAMADGPQLGIKTWTLVLWM